MARYLITGGAGFIGSNIAHRLVARGDKVTVYDDLSTGKKANLRGIEDKIRFVKGDVRDLVELKKQAKRADFILHHAALPSVQRSMKRPMESHDANVV
ncbi:MAG: SDR family NAD(P)-dependent oxidoreductase, partial [Planctomycetota bacterium]